MADKALRTMAEFIYNSQDKYNGKQAARQLSSRPRRTNSNKNRNSINNESGAGKKGTRRGTEWIVVDTDGTEREGHDDGGCPISVLEDCWNPDMREKAAANA